MTNREAIHKLILFRRILEKGVFPVGYRFDAEPFDLAISALEKQEIALEQEFNEWCTDCKEYDKENHCCHRFTKVIRQTVEECKREYANEGWIPVTERLPKEDGRYLITEKTDGVKVQEGYFCRTRDDEPYWGYLHVTAWRPLPEAYMEEEA